MLDTQKAIISIIFLGIITYLLRAIPFIFFMNKKPGKILKYLQKNLPGSAMTILVVYSIKDSLINIHADSWKIYISIFVTIIVYFKFKSSSMLYCIVIGTIAYMALTNLVP